MPFFSPWITAVFIISLTFPFHSETAFFRIPTQLKRQRCESQPIHSCTVEYDPICGSDGNSYHNTCLFCREKRMKNDTFSFLHYGRCVS